MAAPFTNPFRPGAGHMPPHLAGRGAEHREFRRLLAQDTILENMVLTGLRGVGKTVLLDTFKPQAIETGWLWVGTDLSESTSVSEQSLTVRLLSDLATTTAGLVVGRDEITRIGFARTKTTVDRRLDYDTLRALHEATPGLETDKLKRTLETVWSFLARQGKRGVIFAYDEAQTLSDHAGERQYPLSLLLETFQSLQKKELPFLLVLTGLPTLFPKLVEARTFAERMFRVVFLDRLDPAARREAIVKPLQHARCPVSFSPRAVEQVVELSGGYPFFLQFICRELFDVTLQRVGSPADAGVPVEAVLRKLDTDFFAGRWARATDRQRELLEVVAQLDAMDREFSVQEIVARSRELLEKGFSASHANQILAALGANGLVYKNRYGRYSLAVPMLGQFIRRLIQQRQK